MSDKPGSSVNVNTGGGDASVGRDLAGHDIVYNIVNHYGSAANRTANNLPRRITLYGREAELDSIAAALKPTARVWGVLIDGAGGVGKTALALEAGHRAAGFPSKIFLSAKNRELTEGGVRARSDFAITGFIHTVTELGKALGEDGLGKLPPEDRPPTVLRALGEKPALLILDNLETFEPAERDRLFQFLEELPQGCKAIVTSRRRDDIGARPLRLTQLSAEAAGSLLSDLAQDNALLARASAEERRLLIAQAAGNPLLLRWLCGQLGRPGSRCATVAQACALLQNAPPGNDPLEYIFGDIGRTFDPLETQALSALVHFPAPMPVAAIAETADVTVLAAEGALAALARRSILTADPEYAEFTLLPLTAAYARRALPPKEVQAAAERLMAFADKLVKENGYSNHERFPVLEAEWERVAAALPLFLQGENARLQSVCDALYDFLDFTGRWDEGLALLQQAETKAVAAQDYYSAGWRVCHIGHTNKLRGQSAEVLACAERAAAHWARAYPRADAGRREKATAIRLRGLGHKFARDYPAAIAAYREALVEFLALSPDSVDVAIVIIDLADAERLSGDYAAAERDYREALRIAKKANYWEGVATLTNHLAALALDRQQWPQAEALAREALGLAEKVGRLELIAAGCWMIAGALARRGKPAEGLPYARRAVEIYTRLRSPDVEVAQETLKECEGG